jgi:hypothetical protein
MRTVILAVVLVAGTAHAELIECPAKHQNARLTNAGVYMREERVELMGAPKRVPGGTDADFGFNRGDVKWLACQYETATVRWYRLSAKATRCELKKRGGARGKVTVTVLCK